jgi:hypothetical protein
MATVRSRSSSKWRLIFIAQEDCKSRLLQKLYHHRRVVVGHMIFKVGMALDDPYRTPRWLRDLQRFLPLKSQFVLTGNIRDLQLIEASPGQLVPAPLATALATQLIANGYRHVVAYEPTSGFRIAP